MTVTHMSAWAEGCGHYLAAREEPADSVPGLVGRVLHQGQYVLLRGAVRQAAGIPLRLEHAAAGRDTRRQSHHPARPRRGWQLLDGVPSRPGTSPASTQKRGSCGSGGQVSRAECLLPVQLREGSLKAQEGGTEVTAFSSKAPQGPHSRG